MNINTNRKTSIHHWNRCYLLVIPLLLSFFSPLVISNEGIDGNGETNNLEIVKGVYEGFKSGDMEAIIKNMSENIVWLHPGRADQIPFAGKFEGKAGVARFFDIAFSQIDVLDQKIFSFVSSGDKVAVVGFEHMRVKKTGLEYQSNWIHLYTLADGEIIAFEEFIDTAALSDAFLLMRP
jgi:uncharacterized protein